MTDFAKRLALHNLQVELEALRMEGRGMLWQNECDVLTAQSPTYNKHDFDELATKIRETKVQIDDAVTLERLRG